MKTVRARLTGFTIFVVAAILALMGAFVRFRVQANLIGEIDRQLIADTASVRTSKASTPWPLAGLGPFRFIKDVDAPPNDKLIEVLRAQSDEIRLEAQWTPPRLFPIIDGRPGPDVRPAEDPAGLDLAHRQGRTFHEYVRGREPMRSLSVPIRRDGKLVAIVQSTRSMAYVRHQMADLDRALATSIPVAILLAAIGGALLVGSTMRPLRRMTESAHRLEEDLASARLPVAGADEFAELASTINAAFDRTSAAFASQGRALAQLERFTGDAGHELRTPLASIKTNASYLLHLADLPAEHQPTLRLIDVSADRMTKLIGDLLLLARQDGARVPLNRTEVDVDNLIRSVVENTPGSDHLHVDILSHPGLVVCADQDAVERVLINLISNACAYARASISVSARIVDGFLILDIDDDGEGIAPEHVERLGERFFRPDESRSRQYGGVGLGLAIARSLAESHGGKLVIASKLGRGTSVRATFRIGK